MQLMLTNKGPTPLPIGSLDEGGWTKNLPPGIEVTILQDATMEIVLGESPTAAGRDKLKALGATTQEELAVSYATCIDQWKGRSDALAETAVMDVFLLVKNYGVDVTITTPDGTTVLAAGESAYVETVAGTKLTGEADVPEPPFVPVNISITDFTATNPANVLADTTGLVEGDKVRLTATAGNPASMTVVTGSLVTVTGLTPTGFTAIGLNLLPNDVTGLTATGATEEAP